MNFYSSWLFIIGVIILSYSCSDDESDIEVDQTPVNIPLAYHSLEPGNYWIYQVNVWDSNGVFNQVKSIDSSYVVGDTIINQKSYTKIIDFDLQGNQKNLFLRLEGIDLYDSSDQLIVGYDYKGDTVGILQEQGKYSGKLVLKEDLNISTIAGVFEGMISTAIVEVYDAQGSVSYLAELGNYYGKNIGLIKQVGLDWDNKGRIEKTLVRYQVSSP